VSGPRPFPGGHGTVLPPGPAAVPSGASETPETDEASEFAESTGSTWIFETFGIFSTAGPPETEENSQPSGASRAAGAAEIPRADPDPRHARPGRPRMGLTRRQRTLAVVAGGLIATVFGVVGLVTLKGRPADVPRPVAKLGIVPSGAAVTGPSPSGHQLAALPVSLAIPAIDLRSRLTRLGVTAQGTLQVPSSTSVAGWYTGSPRPGDVGSSIIAGHIDSVQGPGVFFRLRLLRPGDLVYVRQAGGRLAVFRVTLVRSYPKNHFPTAAVYGPAPDAELRLITCGGLFDYATGSYLSNVVAYTTEVG
jgi:hypothetical protein